MALTQTPSPEIGLSCPDFSLPGTDGRNHSLKDYSTFDAFLVMFICNHCPYVKAIEDRLIALGQWAKDKSVGIVAISSNDAVKYSEDSFENLKKRAQEKNYPFPYLFDESQAVAKLFGAVCTPDFFLYDQEMKLAYRGRLDDAWKNPSEVQREELKAAISSLLASKAISPLQYPSMGCSIKWRTVL
jgi:peroxiredoxin